MGLEMDLVTKTADEKDLVITTADEKDLVITTADVKDLARPSDLRLEDWKAKES